MAPPVPIYPTHSESSSRRDWQRVPCQEAAPPFAQASSGVSRMVLVGMNGEVKGLDELWVGDTSVISQSRGRGQHNMPREKGTSARPHSTGREGSKGSFGKREPLGKE